MQLLNEIKVDFIATITGVTIEHKFKMLCASWDEENQQKFAVEFDRLMLEFYRHNEMIKELESYALAG